MVRFFLCWIETDPSLSNTSSFEVGFLVYISEGHLWCKYLTLFLFNGCESSILMGIIQRRFQGVAEGLSAPFFCNHLFFFLCNHFKELQTVLFEVELIINNASLIYIYPNTIETCLTPKESNRSFKQYW